MISCLKRIKVMNNRPQQFKQRYSQKLLMSLLVGNVRRDIIPFTERSPRHRSDIRKRKLEKKILTSTKIMGISTVDQ